MLISHPRSRFGFLVGLVLGILHIAFFLIEVFAGRFTSHELRTPVVTPWRNVTTSTPGAGVDWNAVFSFIPLGMKNCSELFPDQPKSVPFGTGSSPKWKVYRKKLIATYLKSVEKEGHCWNQVELGMVLRHLARQQHVLTVCETGFNAGHSAYTFLSASSKVNVYSFELGPYSYSKALAKVLKDSFPSRFHVTWGDSRSTIKLFRKRHPNVNCDVIFIDGGRSFDVVSADFANLLKMSSVNGIVVFNNYPPRRNSRIGRVWEHAKRLGDVTEVLHCDYLPHELHGFSVGRVNI